MSCFQPQLAQFQKRSLDDAVKAMNLTPEDPVFWIEEKLDGERMQMHYDNGKFMFWSRKAKDYTRLYGSCFDDGSLTRHLRGAFDTGVKRYIRSYLICYLLSILTKPIVSSWTVR